MIRVVPQIGRFFSYDDKGLKLTTGKIFLFFRDEAVEEAIAGILGDVKDAGLRVERDGLVAESSELLERDGLLELTVVSGLHLKAIPVLLAALRGEIRGLLTGDPSSPRHRAACAVPVGAGEREELAEDLAADGIVDDVRGSSNVRKVTGAAEVVGLLFVEILRRFIAGEGALRLLGGGKLMVSDKDDAAIFSGETGHTIWLSGDAETIAHGISGGRDDLVGKALGEVEDALGIGDERPVGRGHAGSGLGAEVVLKTYKA